jgi:DNA-binding NarL/FixJ family response regulator
MIRVTIIDDHHLFAEGVIKLLNDVHNIHMDKAFCSFNQFCETEQLTDFDVMLLDINLDTESGLDICHSIKEKDTRIKIIALTMINEMSVIRKMINHGADGYLLKNVDKPELIKAIKEVYKGNQYLGKNTSHIVFNKISNQQKRQPKYTIPTLSRREKEVLELIVEEFTTQEIADTLFIGFSTVETHRRNLSIKLGARNTAGLVRIALEYGLL